MTNWKHTLKLKELFSENEDPETVRSVAREAYSRVEAFRAAYYPDDIELEEISDNFHTLGFVDERPECRHFNAALGELYDWGDDGHRLWVD